MTTRTNSELTNRGLIEAHKVVTTSYRWAFSARSSVLATVYSSMTTVELTLETPDGTVTDRYNTEDLQKIVDVIRLANSGVK